MDNNGNLKSTPTKELPSQTQEKDVKRMLDRFSIGLTGCRKGDLLTGTMPASNNAINKHLFKVSKLFITILDINILF